MFNIRLTAACTFLISNCRAIIKGKLNMHVHLYKISNVSRKIQTGKNKLYFKLQIQQKQTNTYFKKITYTNKQTNKPSKQTIKVKQNNSQRQYYSRSNKLFSNKNVDSCILRQVARLIR